MDPHLEQKKLEPTYLITLAWKIPWKELPCAVIPRKPGLNTSEELETQDYPTHLTLGFF